MRQSSAGGNAASFDALPALHASLLAVIETAALNRLPAPSRVVLAAQAGVTYLAVEAAFAELERAGLIVAERRNGARRFLYVRLGVLTDWDRPELLEARKKPKACARPRPCLCCGATFASDGPGHRLCGLCRAKDEGPAHALPTVSALRSLGAPL